MRWWNIDNYVLKNNIGHNILAQSGSIMVNSWFGINPMKSKSKLYKKLNQPNIKGKNNSTKKRTQKSYISKQKYHEVYMLCLYLRKWFNLIQNHFLKKKTKFNKTTNKKTWDNLSYF